MVKRDEFAALVQRLADGRSVRSVAKEVGISHTAIYEMQDGWVPSFRLLERFASGMKLDEVQKEALFQAAGYTLVNGEIDFDLLPDPVLTSIAETARGLKPEQRKIVLSVARGLAGGVMRSHRAGARLAGAVGG